MIYNLSYDKDIVIDNDQQKRGPVCAVLLNLYQCHTKRAAQWATVTWTPLCTAMLHSATLQLHE